MSSRVNPGPSIEDVFSSKGRTRLLKVLAEVDELNITEIVRRAGLNHTAASRHLKALRTMGLIEEKTFGKIRILSLKQKDPRAAAIRALVCSWRPPVSH